MLFLRGAFAGLSIGIAVLLSTTSSEAAGIVSVFPSIFLTSMVVRIRSYPAIPFHDGLLGQALWLSQHSSVPIGAVGPMMLGSASVSVYAVLYAIFVVYQEVDALAAVPLYVAALSRAPFLPLSPAPSTPAPSADPLRRLLLQMLASLCHSVQHTNLPLHQVANNSNSIDRGGQTASRGRRACVVRQCRRGG